MAQTAVPLPPSGALPRPILRALRRVDRQIRGVAALRGIGTAALVSALTAAVFMAADYVWGLPNPARWAAWNAWVLATGVCLLVMLARVAGRSPRAVELAAVVERGDARLGEVLTAAVDLVQRRNQAHGSPELIAALAHDASSRVHAIELSRAVPSGPATKRFALGLAVASLVAVPAFVWPDTFGVLALRLVTPWADIDRVGRYLVAVEPGNTVVAIGDDLTISGRVISRLGRAVPTGGATLEWADSKTGRTLRQAMEEDSTAKGEGRTFRTTVLRLTDNITYRVVSASGDSRRYRAEAVAPPAIATLTARVEPPSYTKRPAADAKDPSRIDAREDSKITLTVMANNCLHTAEVSWPSPVKPGAATGEKPEPRRFPMAVTGDGHAASVTLPADASGEYTINLVDRHELKSRPEPARRVVVRPDAPPAVAVKGLDGLDQSRGDDVLRVGISAKDDVAVASAELHYAIERFADARPSTDLMGTPEKPGATEEGHISGKLDGLDTATARGDVTLGLKALDLKPDDVVLYRIRVADNRPAPRGPNVVWSAPRRLAIATNAPPLWAKRSTSGRDTVRAKLEALKKAAAENRRETEQLRYAADAVQRGNGAWDRDRQQNLAKREAEARTLGEDLQQLARALTEEPVFRSMARPARQLAEVEAEAARATLDQARQQDDPAKRFADLRQADARLGAVSTRLEDLQRQFDALAERDADRRRLQDLADRQAQVAEHAESTRQAEGAPPDRAQLDQLEAEQNRVRKDLDALLQKSPELRADVLDAQAEEAEALARRAREIAARQREEARNAADLTRKAAELRKLAEEQRAIENDARRLALDVDTPLIENGRGRLNVDPLRQAAEPVERGDIPQGKQAMIGAEAELRRLARDLEDVPGDVKALAQRLAARQDQLANETLEALAETRGKTSLPGDDRKALAKRLEPLAQRQKKLANLAKAILDTDEAKSDRDRPRFPSDIANQTAEAVSRASETTAKSENPRDVEQRVNEARNAMNRLAQSIPDRWQKDARLRQKLNEARHLSDEAARQVERDLRETEQHLQKEPMKAADDLANRLGAMADRTREAAKRLDEIAPDMPPRAEPQRARAARRTRALAEAVEAVRQQAPNGKPDRFDAARARAIRDALHAAMMDTLTTSDRVEQKLNGQVPADDLAAELLDEQKALLKPSKAEEEGAESRASAQRRIASALRTLPAPDALMEQAEAIRQAERAASALAAAESKKQAPGDAKAEDAVRRAAEATQALADRLAARATPRARIETLARAERALNDVGHDPAAAPDAEESMRRQRAAAAELARLAAKSKDAPKAELVAGAQEAVEAAADIARRTRQPDESVPGRGKPDPAARRDANDRAAEALDKLAAAPGKTADDSTKEQVNTKAPKIAVDPDMPIEADHAAKARELALRERRLRERLQALLSDRVAPQQEVRRESSSVGQALADLRDRTRDLSPNSFGQANQAASLLGEQAPQAMDDASNQLAQGQPTPARDAQRRAADLAERGAQNAEDLASSLRNEAERGRQMEAEGNVAAESKHQPSPSALADARASMASAAKQLGQAREASPSSEKGHSLDSARAAIRGAAEKLQAAAEAQSRGLGEPSSMMAQESNPGEAADGPARDPKGGRAGIAKADTLRELQDLVRKKTGRAWGELPGHLRSELLQMSQGKYRDDYARLIQLYFREIAAGAEEKP